MKIKCGVCKGKLVSRGERILGICKACGKRHAEEFHKKFDLKDSPLKDGGSY